MKALTVCQPYAELIARGEKWIENRTWPTSYRGLLAIHAGKSREWLGVDDEDAAEYGVDVKAIAFGAIVAVARLVDCRRFEDLTDEMRMHTHANGPWCWVLRDVYRVEPMPIRGAQGLWPVEPSLALSLMPVRAAAHR